MRAILLVGLLSAGFTGLLGGCATVGVGSGGEFRISGHQANQGDRVFIVSEFNRLTAKPYSLKLKNNAVGVFANPAAIGNSWYLLIENVVEQTKDSNKKQLNGFVRLQVRTDSTEFSVEPSEHSFGKARVLKNAHRETATFQMNEGQIARMINAQSLEFYIVGSSRTIVVNNENLAASFQFHLSEFYRLAKARQADASAGQG